MSSNTSTILGGYNLFRKMDSTADTHRPVHGVIRSYQISYYVAIACALLAVYLYQLTRQQKRLDIPFYKAAKRKWIFDAETLVKDSYNKFYDKVYQIRATEGLQVLIPPRFLGELKVLPEDTLSASVAVDEAMLSEYTKFSLGHNGDLMSNLVRTKLTQNLNRLVPQLKKEIEFVVGTEFPECNDWTAVKVQPFALRAIARLSGRAFVGPSINRNEQWMDLSINFAIHVFIAVVKLQFFPEWLRPAGQYLVSELRLIRKDIARATAMLKPIIEERLRDMDTPGYEEPDDLCQWLLNTLSEEDKNDIEGQARMQLILSAGSIHTTNNLLVDCFLDLAVHPEVQEELRQEVMEILDGDDAWARKDNMARLKKMDSFIKESQRCSGNVTGFIRKVMKPINLSDGTHLPAGTKILAPQAGVSRDAHFYSQPDTFDALRFFKMRQQSEEDANRWHFTSIGDTNVNFGAGKHSCPGRFFAGNEIKMMLAHFLLNFDMKLKNGEERPKSFMLMMSKTPNPNGEVMFRRRTVEA